MQFNTTFYASPVVLVSVHHYYDRKGKNHIPPENNIITAWVEVGHSLSLYVYSIWQFGQHCSSKNSQVNTHETHLITFRLYYNCSLIINIGKNSHHFSHFISLLECWTHINEDVRSRPGWFREQTRPSISRFCCDWRLVLYWF